jgi:hypothetical protein
MFGRIMREAIDAKPGDDPLGVLFCNIHTAYET